MKFEALDSEILKHMTHREEGCRSAYNLRLTARSRINIGSNKSMRGMSNKAIVSHLFQLFGRVNTVNYGVHPPEKSK